MQKYSATSVFIRIKYALIDEMRENFRLYLTYFVILAVGLIVGIIWGIKISGGDFNCNVYNYLGGLMCGDSGILSLFFDNLITFILFGALLVFALKVPFLVWVTMIGTSFFLAKGVRDGVILIVSCGGGGVVTALLFYIIFRLIYCIVLSFSIVCIILKGKFLPCSCTKQVLIRTLILYGITLLVCLVYSIIVSIVIKIILV